MEQELKMSAIDRYFSPDNEILFVAGLHMSYTVANYQLYLLTTLLTTGWNMALFYAVCITTIQNAIKKLLVIPSAYVADKFLGHTKMLLLSASSYCGGLFVWHFLVGYPDPEQTVKPKFPLAWISLSLAMMTLGQCGYDYYKERKPMDSSIQEGVVAEADSSNQVGVERARRLLHRQKGFIMRRRHCLSFCKEIMYMLAINRFRIIGIVIASWLTLTNLIIAIALAISVVVLCIGKLAFYPFDEPEGSPLSLVFRVLLVAFKHRRYCHTPQSSYKYYYGDDNAYQYADHGQNPAELQLQSEAHISANVDDNIGVKNDGHPQEIELPLLEPRVTDQNQADDNILNQANTDDIIVDDDNDDSRDDGSNIISGDNLHYGLSGSAGDIEEGEQTFEQQNGHIDQIWYLKKAALYNSSKVETPKKEADNKRLCTVNQVKEVKKFLQVTQLSLIFVMYGLMESVSSTFFVEQGDKMNTSTSYMDVPVQVIMFSSEVTEYLVRLMLTNCNTAKKNVQQKRTRFHGARRIGMGMALSIVCFMVAFWIEHRRLQALKINLIMSAFWLIPQCSLLGAIRGLVVPDEFFEEEMPKSFTRSSYGSVLAGGVIAIGRLLSLLVLLIVYICSKTGTESGWIGHDINSSHIDYYYAVMAGFGVVCCAIHGWVTYSYCRHQRRCRASKNRNKRDT